MNADRRMRIACNRYFIYAMLLCAFMAWMAGIMFCDGEIGVGIGCAIFALFLLAVPILVMPFCYRFDTEGVTLCYLFVPNERYLWKNIRAIEVDYDRRGATTFRLEAKPEGKCRFYMEGKLHKNRRTKRLLETYWDGTITGCFFEGLHNWWCRRKKKKENEIRQHIADEVIPMERAVRAEARSALALHGAQAGQMGLKLRIKFCYTTKELEELNSRPDRDYAYTVLVELCRPGETDESRIITTSADLLHVRLGKTAYRGVKDDDALPDLRQELADVLEEVRRNGIDACCVDIEEVNE